MASIPQHLRKPIRYRNRPTDPTALFLAKRGDYTTVLWYGFTRPSLRAIQAQKAYFGMQFFEPMYFKLMRATVGSSLTMDRRSGDLVLTSPRLSLVGLVSKSIIKELTGQVQSNMISLVIGAKFEKLFGILSMLNDLKKRLKNERLLSRHDAATRQKRVRERLKLIAALVGKSKAPSNPYAWQVNAVQNYDKYESARQEYLKYIYLDLKYRGIKIDNRAKISARR